MLTDQIAIVTGAAAGIGESTALLFAAMGAGVAVLDRDTEGTDRVARKIVEEGGRAIAVPADMRDRASLEACVEATVAAFGKVDILINNAGVYPRQSFLDVSDDEWDEMHDINLKGTFRMSQIVARRMTPRRSGKIVNISSVTFFLGTPLLSHYVASKGGVIGLTRSMARELGEHNIHVNCITPGAIRTESEKFFVSDEQSRAFIESQSLKRRLMPIDVARVCAFLSSQLSDGMTGQTLNVDAGWMMH